MTHRYLTLLAILLSATPFAEMIPSTNRTDWTWAGVVGGIVSRTTIFTNYASTATAAEIQAGITACPSNQVVQLGAGTFSLNAYFTIGGGDRGITIRGDGISNTVLTASGALGGRYFLIGPYNSETGPITINNGYTKGSSNITVASASGLSEGMMFRSSPQNDTNFMWSTSTPQATNMQTHIGKIMSISGTDLTIWPPLHWGTNAAFPTAYLYHYGSANNHAEMVGIENLVIDATSNAQTTATDWQQSYSCWMTNVTTILINNYHHRIQRNACSQFSKNTVWESPGYDPNHSGFLVGPTGHREAVTSSIFRDNIINKVHPGFEVQAGSAGNVIAHNFIWDTLYGNPPTTQARGMYSNHEPHAMLNLYEGNCVNSIMNDGLFGSASHNNYFRNWITSWTPSYGSTNGFGMALCRWSLWENSIGNVFGTTNFTFQHYMITNGVYGTDETWSHVYRFGYPNAGNDTYDGERPPDTDPADTLDLNVLMTVNIHGDWSNIEGQTWNPDNADHDIPESFYLGETKPDWWFGLEWPPFDPANGYTNLTFEIINPAGYRFFNAGQDPPASGPSGAVGNAYGHTARVGTVRPP